MTQDPSAASAARVPISFDASVSSVPPQDVNCGSCAKPLRATYHMLGESMMCGACRVRLEGTTDGSARANRFGRALLFGTGAAIAGALVYYAIMAATGYSIGLLAILVGYMVGRAVNVGSRGKGGRKYQFLAALLTYLAMSSTYVAGGLRQISEETSHNSTAGVPNIPGATGVVAMDGGVETLDEKAAPDVRAELGNKGQPAGEKQSSKSRSMLVGIITILILVLVSPILAGFSSPILLLILGFGVYQAWKMNRAVTVHFTGPFDLRQTTPPAAA
jgi:hypothetical protein